MALRSTDSCIHTTQHNKLCRKMNEQLFQEGWWLVLLKILTPDWKLKLNSSLFQVDETPVFNVTYLERFFNKPCENTQYAGFLNVLGAMKCFFRLLMRMLLAGRLDRHNSFPFLGVTFSKQCTFVYLIFNSLLSPENDLHLLMQH